MNKYHAVKTWSELCKRTFDSKAEARRGEELALLERAGVIADLEYQIKFTLCIQPRITVTLDFYYWDKEKNEKVYEDVKGVLARDSRTKYAWLEKETGVVVRLVR